MASNGQLYPSAQDCEALARAYFNQVGRKDLHWADLNEKEQIGLVAQWRGEREQKAQQSGSGPSWGARMFASMRTYVERNNQTLLARLPELIEKDLSAIVKAALDHELHYVWQRQSEQAIRQAERLDQMAALMAQIKASDGKTHAQALDLWITELQTEVRRQGQELAELRARLR